MGCKPSRSINLSFVILSQSSSGAVLLLTGSAGAGKTATVHVLANELGFEVQEWINPLSETDSKSLGGGLPNKRAGLLIRNFEKNL